MCWWLLPLTPVWSLFDHVEMQDELAAVFGRHVDLVAVAESSVAAIPFVANLSSSRQRWFMCRDASYITDILQAAYLLSSTVRASTFLSFLP